MTFCSCNDKQLVQAFMATKKLDNFYCNSPIQVKRVFQVLQSLGGKALKKSHSSSHYFSGAVLPQAQPLPTPGEKPVTRP
jgi:hypothetical protein